MKKSFFPICQIPEYLHSWHYLYLELCNVDNLSVIVMVVNANNEAKNSQHAEVGENKQYE